jgi:protoporphyrinogen oxidase
LIDKLRAAPVALYLRLARNWRALEQHTAHDWCSHWMGANGYRILFEPLLVGKFGDYYREVNMAWFWARLHKRSNRLGYFVGGFQAFADALTDRIRAHGADIRLGEPVQSIQVECLPVSPGCTTSHLTVHTGPTNASGASAPDPASAEVFDRVVVTLSPDQLASVVPDLPAGYREELKQLKSMGALALILALKRPLTDGHYWINLPKGEGFPFLALVEHTNFIDSAHYGGDHLVYCGDYLKPDHEYFGLSQEELLARFLPALSRFNPSFTPDWVRRSWLFREGYAQPVPFVNHSHHIPDLATPIAGLYWASMSQIYPWDRGTNYAVDLGWEVARRAATE